MSMTAVLIRKMSLPSVHPVRGRDQRGRSRPGWMWNLRPLGAAATRRLAHVGWSITNSAASRPATPCIDQAPGLHGIASEAAAQPICRFSERSITLRFRRRRQIEEAPLHVLAASIQVRQADADQPYWTTAT